MKILTIGFLFALLPIWKVPMIQNGLNLFEYMGVMISKDKPYQHISYEEAVNRAHSAYEATKQI